MIHLAWGQTCDVQPRYGQQPHNGSHGAGTGRVHEQRWGASSLNSQPYATGWVTVNHR
jgi:hypothetical protein